MERPAHRALLVDNHIDDGSAVMVLQRRPLSGTFVVRNQVLQCQDMLRELYVKDLRDVTVYGRGWDQATALGPGVKIGHTLGNHADQRSAVDIYSHHTFAIVLENVDADGYVSEKLYDALVAGCIPVYYGNNNELVGIPDDLYIDLRRFSSSAELQAHLDTVDIAAFKQRIRAGREAVLRAASAGYFADSLLQAMRRAER